MNNREIIEEEITGKTVLSILLRYKYIVIITMITFTVLASIFAYLKPDVYRAYTNIQLLEEKENSVIMLSGAFEDSRGNSDDQISLLQSNLMLDKALEKLELGTRYFFKNKFKTHEMYKESPFIVEVLSMENMIQGKPIYIEPIDKTHFRLKIKDTGFSLKKLKKLIFSTPAIPIVYSKVYQYGELITTSWFKIKVQKLSEIGNKEYFFTYVPNIYMRYMIATGLSAGFAKKGSSVLEISYEDTVPLRAKEVVNVVTQTYFEDEVLEKLKSTNNSLAYLDTQLEALTKILNQSASKLRTFKQSNTDITIDGVTESTAESIEKTEVKLREIEYKESVLANLKAYIDSGKDLTSVTLTESEYADETLIKKLDQFQALNDEYRRVLTVYTEFHPEVIKVSDDMNRLKQSIQYLVGNSLKRIQKEKNYQTQELNTLQSSLVSLPQKERQLASLTRNFAVNEKIYSFLLEKRTEMQILNSSTTPNIRILDKASVPSFAFKPKRGYIVFIGAILGLIAGFVIAFLLYIRDDTIKNIEEVEVAVNIPFFGFIPQLTKGKYTIAYEEAFRTLRTNLEFVQISKPSKTVLVTSSISGEGKSTCIKNIAEMFVKLNKKVIVLDFDLRKPSAHKIFKGINNDNGVSMLLSGQCALGECIQKTHDNIDLIAAGPSSPNPSELIMSEAAKLLLGTLGKTYDYILIDTPPYSVVTDASILIKEADIVLFSFMEDYSKRNSIKELNTLVAKFDLKNAGIIYQGLKLKKKERVGYGYYEA